MEKLWQGWGIFQSKIFHCRIFGFKNGMFWSWISGKIHNIVSRNEGGDQRPFRVFPDCQINWTDVMSREIIFVAPGLNFDICRLNFHPDMIFRLELNLQFLSFGSAGALVVLFLLLSYWCLVLRPLFSICSINSSCLCSFCPHCYICVPSSHHCTPRTFFFLHMFWFI